MQFSGEGIKELYQPMLNCPTGIADSEYLRLSPGDHTRFLTLHDYSVAESHHLLIVFPPVLIIAYVLF